MQTRTTVQRALAGSAKETMGGMLNHDHLYKAALTELEQFRNEVFVSGALVETVLERMIAVEGAPAKKLFVRKAVTTMKSLGYSCDLASSGEKKIQQLFLH